MLKVDTQTPQQHRTGQVQTGPGSAVCVNMYRMIKEGSVRARDFSFHSNVAAVASVMFRLNVGCDRDTSSKL